MRTLTFATLTRSILTTHAVFATVASTLVAALLPINSTFAADIAKGQVLFAERCAMCHGDKGAGDGALAATMPEGQKPRNLAAGGNKYATDDSKLKEVIQQGGAAFGLSVLMPAQSDLNDAQIGDLVAFVNSLKK